MWSKVSVVKPKTKTVRKRLADGSVRTYEYARSKVAPAKSPADSLSNMIAAYQRSPEWDRLSDARKKKCALYFKRLSGLGDYPAATVKRQHIRAVRDAIFSTGKPGAANGFVNVASALFGWGVKADWLEHNPARSIDIIPGGHLPAWSQAQADHAIADLPEHLRRLVLLALFTGQRRGDLCRMAWTHYDGERIRVTQGKTGTPLVIPVHPTLKAAMDQWPRRATTILVSSRGRPWSPNRVTDGLRKALARIGFEPGRNVHGLRKLAATNLAEAGCSAHEIAAITGHRSLAMVSLYTRSADQENLATAAIIRLQARKS
jgi:integrase